MGEPTHGVDGLIGQVVIGGSVVLDKLKLEIKIGIIYLTKLHIKGTVWYLEIFFSEPWKIIT
jgi:hypothetical protein